MSEKELVIFDVLNTLISDKIQEVANGVKEQLDDGEATAYIILPELHKANQMAYIQGLYKANQIVNECIYQSKKPILDAIVSIESQKKVIFCSPDDFELVKSQYPSDSARIIKSDFIPKGIQYGLPPMEKEE